MILIPTYLGFDPTTPAEIKLRAGSQFVVVICISQSRRLESSRLAESQEEADDWYSREGLFISSRLHILMMMLHRIVLRLRVAQEILLSERKYVSCLNIIGEIFEAPMRDSALISPAVSPYALDRPSHAHDNQEMIDLFPPQLAVLRQKHTDLLSRLEERMTSWKWQGAREPDATLSSWYLYLSGLLGDIFARFSASYDANILHAYSQYVNEFAKSVSAIRKAWNRL